jgi:hypothetical protein
LPTLVVGQSTRYGTAAPGAWLEPAPGLASSASNRRNSALPRSSSAPAAINASTCESSSEKSPAPFHFEWEGVPVSGQFGADFSGAAPRAQFEAAAQHVDLGVVLARLGWNGVALRAGLLSIRGRAEGTKLGDLLASTTLDVALDRGRFDLQRRPGPGLPGRGEFSATLKAAAPGQPTTLAAHGAMDAETFDVTVDASPLAGFLRADVAMPVTLRASIGDVSVEGSGSVLRNGTGDGRIKLSGGRLDRLGALLGLALPEVQPYAASSRITISAGALRLSDLDASFGRSHVSGELAIRMQEAGRRWHLAKLRMPVLHLEDIGAARGLRGALPPQCAAAREAPAARGEETEIAGWLDTLRAIDVDTTHTRILGELQANLMTRQVSGRLRLAAKEPTLFRLAPTMLIGGTIEDPSLTAGPENLLLVPLRFANPLSGFAGDWHRGRGPSGDATASNREAFVRIRKARSEDAAARPG